MKALLVETPQSRQYYSGYAPLSLLKIGRYHKEKGDECRILCGKWNYDQLQTFSSDLFGSPFVPDIIYITTLFTYSWRATQQTIKSVLDYFPNTPVRVGGIYATLCTDHLQAAFGERIEIHRGLWKEVDGLIPDYSLVPEWETSQIQSQRGCPRKCKFCYVQTLEPKYKARKSIKKYIMPEHKKVTLFDNNVLASPYWREIMTELADSGKEIDFNSGLDCRIIKEDIIPYIKAMKIKQVRIAYDSLSVKRSVQKAIDILAKAGIRKRDIICYCLYNYTDSPDNFHERLADLLHWGVTTFPTRFEPPLPRDKHTEIGEHWTKGKLGLVQKMRVNIGVGGAFPPTRELLELVADASDFNDAMLNVSRYGGKVRVYDGKKAIEGEIL